MTTRITVPPLTADQVAVYEKAYAERRQRERDDASRVLATFDAGNKPTIIDFAHAMMLAEAVFIVRRPDWLAVSDAIAEQILNAVPPLAWHDDKFACGESYSDRDGERVYHCFRHFGTGVAELRICSIRELENA